MQLAKSVFRVLFGRVVCIAVWVVENARSEILSNYTPIALGCIRLSREITCPDKFLSIGRFCTHDTAREVDPL